MGNNLQAGVLGGCCFIQGEVDLRSRVDTVVRQQIQLTSSPITNES